MPDVNTRLIISLAALSLLTGLAGGQTIIGGGTTVVIDDSNSPWQPGIVQLGENGWGTVQVEPNCIVEADAAYVGGFPGDADGRVIVHGPGAAWHSAGVFWLGFVDSGNAVVTDGGQITCDTAIIGGPSTALSLSGEMSTFDASDALRVGQYGPGSATAEDGSAIECMQLDMGFTPHSPGMLRVTGPGSTLSAEIGKLGYASDATIDIAAGGAATFQTLELGLHAGHRGDLIITGSASSADITGALTIGAQGPADASVDAGHLSAGETVISAEGTSGLGTLTVAGGGLAELGELTVGPNGRIVLADPAKSTPSTVTATGGTVAGSLFGHGTFHADTAEQPINITGYVQGIDPNHMVTLDGNITGLVTTFEYDGVESRFDGQHVRIAGRWEVPAHSGRVVESYETPIVEMTPQATVAITVAAGEDPYDEENTTVLRPGVWHVDDEGWMHLDGTLELMLEDPNIAVGTRLRIIDCDAEYAAGLFDNYTGRIQGHRGLLLHAEHGWDEGLYVGIVLAGDANDDRVVDVGDLGILASNWNQAGTDWATGDFTGDGGVDVGDLGVLASCWGLTADEPAGVPEPASLALLTAGSLGLLARRRRHRPTTTAAGRRTARRQSHVRPRRGLTMLETVTAVGIAAVTGAMLVPAIKELDTSARQTVCQANQAEFTRTMLCYTSENQGAWLTSACKDLGYPVLRSYFNASSKIGRAYDFTVRFSLYHAGRDVNEGIWNGDPDDRETFENEGSYQDKWWQLVADSTVLWCPDAAGPESVTEPFGFSTHRTGFAMENGIIGTSIVPNGRLSPVSNFPWRPVASRVYALAGPADESLICVDGTELGVKTFSGAWRSGYTGEYADPMFRHGSSYRPADNMDQGWWQAPYGWGPPPGVQPRGDGTVNVGMLDGHVETMDEPTMSARWEAGEINYELR